MKHGTVFRRHSRMTVYWEDLVYWTGYRRSSLKIVPTTNCLSEIGFEVQSTSGWRHYWWKDSQSITTLWSRGVKHPERNEQQMWWKRKFFKMSSSRWSRLVLKVLCIPSRSQGVQELNRNRERASPAMSQNILLRTAPKTKERRDLNGVIFVRCWLQRLNHVGTRPEKLPWSWEIFYEQEDQKHFIETANRQCFSSVAKGLVNARPRRRANWTSWYHDKFLTWAPIYFPWTKSGQVPLLTSSHKEEEEQNLQKERDDCNWRR